MRFFILLPILILASKSMLAQPVLDASYYSASGTRFRMCDNIRVGTSHSIPSSGPNQVWIYNNITCSNFTDFRALPASQGMYADSFPNSDLVFQSPSGEEYYTAMLPNGSGYQGVYSTGNPIYKYNPPLRWLPFNLAFGETYTDTSANSNTPWVIINGQYAGYGTLIINGISIQNVVLFDDSVSFCNMDFTLRQSNHEYFMFAPGVGRPVAYFASTQGRPWYAYILTDIITGLPPLKRIQSLSIFPQPAKTFVTLQLPPGESFPVKVLIRNPAGQLVQSRLNSDHNISLNALPPGLYTLEVQGKKTYRARLVKE